MAEGDFCTPPGVTAPHPDIQAPFLNREPSSQQTTARGDGAIPAEAGYQLGPEIPLPGPRAKHTRA
jgi:hypothetical protein